MKNDKLDNVAKQETPQFAVNTNPVVQTELPKGFPKDLPTEKDAKVLKNSESTTTDGRVQSSRTVTTSRTLEQATKVYVDFFTKQGWKVVSSQGNLTMMLKGDDSLLIEAKAGADENTISLNLTQAQSN